MVATDGRNIANINKGPDWNGKVPAMRDGFFFQQHRGFYWEQSRDLNRTLQRRMAAPSNDLAFFPVGGRRSLAGAVLRFLEDVNPLGRKPPPHLWKLTLDPPGTRSMEPNELAGGV